MRAASRVCAGGEVAALAEVSVEYYAKLERGAIGGVSASVLDAIARALQLDDAERTHLFNLAHTADPTSAGMRPRRRVSKQWTPRRSLTWVLDKITAPAIIRNGRMDLRALHVPRYGCRLRLQSPVGDRGRHLCRHPADRGGPRAPGAGHHVGPSVGDVVRRNHFGLFVGEPARSRYADPATRPVLRATAGQRCRTVRRRHGRGGWTVRDGRRPGRGAAWPGPRTW